MESISFSPANTVNSVIPGVTLQLLQTKLSTPVTVSLQSDPPQISSALQNFVSNYNQLEKDLQAQQGAILRRALRRRPRDLRPPADAAADYGFLYLGQHGH